MLSLVSWNLGLSALCYIRIWQCHSTIPRIATDPTRGCCDRYLSVHLYSHRWCLGRRGSRALSKTWGEVGVLDLVKWILGHLWSLRLCYFTMSFFPHVLFMNDWNKCKIPKIMGLIWYVGNSLPDSLHIHTLSKYSFLSFIKKVLLIKLFSPYNEAY